MANRWHPTQAVGPDGQRADVVNVLNGLKCQCLCFACQQPVVAKQGPALEWHFAHYAATNCRPTRESELHFFAKSLLAERLWLWIPPVNAITAKRTECISVNRKYEFSEVKVEKADGNVRPDLLLIAQSGKALHIEIFVRHKVDSKKLRKLKDRGLSSVEIDLSNLNWYDRTGWESAVLETAPREWLHNAKAARLEQKMEAIAAQEAKKKASATDAEFKRMSVLWQTKANSFDTPDKQLEAERALAMRRGFYSMVGHSPNGSGCFVVSPEYWQARIVNRFLWDEIAGSPRKFETIDALCHVEDLIRPNLTRISKETAARMAATFPDFLTPWHTVHSYLKWLKEFHWMFSKTVRGNEWLPSGSAIHHREEQETIWQADVERRARLADWLNYILSDIPIAEICDFDGARWIDWFVVSYAADEDRIHIEAINQMVKSGEGLAADILGLPLANEYERQEKAQEDRRAEESRKRLVEMDRVSRERRLALIRDEANQVLGTEAFTWLETSNEKIGGMSPLHAVSASDEGLTRATTELRCITETRKAAYALELAEAKKCEMLKKNRDELEKLANQRSRDPFRASLWCKSPNPKLGGQRPFDFCTDARALRVCRDIMPKNL